MLQVLEQYTLLLQYTLIFSSVLMLVALGGCFSEHSGVINLGLEGIMVIGALGGALFMYYFQDYLSGFPIIALTVLASVFCGVVYSALLGLACINFKADQTIVGTALNLLGTAAATVIVKAVNLARDGKPSDELIYRVGRSSFIKSMTFGETNFEFNWFMAIALIMLIVAYIVLYKTKFGLRLMSCGEHPQAAASVGISVYKMRWSGVLISGAYGGLGGLLIRCCRLRLPFARRYDLRTVETRQDRACVASVRCVPRTFECQRKHLSAFESQSPADSLQYAAVHCFFDCSCIHIQEIARTESRRYPVRQRTTVNA